MNGIMIRIIRALYSLNQVEFAERIGVSGALVAYMENGKRSISETVEERIRYEFQLSDDRVKELIALSRSPRRTIIFGNVPAEHD